MATAQRRAPGTASAAGHMNPYFEVAIVSFGAGVGVLAVAALVRLLLHALGGMGRFLGPALGIAALVLMFGALAAPMFLILSIEHLRLFVRSGSWPRIWQMVCYVLAVLPSIWYLGRPKSQ